MNACDATNTKHRQWGSRAAATAVALAAAVAVAGASGCSTSPGDPRGSADDTGRVGLQLTAAPGISLNSVSYTITGPSSFTRTGTIDVAASPNLSVIIGGVAPGSPYTMALAAQSLDGATACAGAATFSVTAGMTTGVVVPLDCHLPVATGSIGVAGVVNVCPVIDALEANPSQVFVGGTVALAGVAHDPDGGPQALSYHWSASAGAVSDASVPNPTFTCSSAGTASLTLIVSDGDGQASCGTTASVTVTCLANDGNAGSPNPPATTPGAGGTCTFHTDNLVWNTDQHGTANMLLGPLTMSWSQSDNRLTAFDWDTYQLVTVNSPLNQITPTDFRQVEWDYALAVGQSPIFDGGSRTLRGYVANQDSAGSGLGTFSGIFEGASTEHWMGAQGTLDCDFGLASGVHITQVTPADGSRIDVGDGGCGDSTTHLTVASRDGRNDVAVSYAWTATFFGPDGVTAERSDVAIGTGADVAWAPALGGGDATGLDPAACETGSSSAPAPTAGQRIDVTVTASDTTGSHRSRTITVYALCSRC